MLKIKLHWQVLISMLLALLISFIVKHFNAEGSQWVSGMILACDFMGRLFLNALKMIVVPLIGGSIISGVIGIGSQKDFGRLGFKTILFYTVTCSLAVMVTLLLVNIIKPGEVDLATAEKMLAQAKQPEEFTNKIESKGASDVLEVLIRTIPDNIVEASSDNTQLLGIIFFSLIFGFYASRLPQDKKELQEKFWSSVLDVMMNIADLVIMFAPIGVFALVTPKFIDFGFALFIPVFKFTITVLLGLLIYFFVILPLFLLLMGRVNPWTHLRAMTPALLTSFSTSSSVSTLPVTMECVEEVAGVSNRVSSFTLPLGATVNMGGTALYECVVVIFVAQFYQTIDPTFSFGLASQLVVVLLSLLTSIGVAGIPSASLVAIAVILGVVGLPVEYMGIVLVVDRVLDMCRTLVNVYSDTVAAVVIARTEGEELFLNQGEMRKK